MKNERNLSVLQSVRDTLSNELKLINLSVKGFKQSSMYWWPYCVKDTEQGKNSFMMYNQFRDMYRDDIKREKIYATLSRLVKQQMKRLTGAHTVNKDFSRLQSIRKGLSNRLSIINFWIDDCKYHIKRYNKIYKTVESKTTREEMLSNLQRKHDELRKLKNTEKKLIKNVKYVKSQIKEFICQKNL